MSTNAYILQFLHGPIDLYSIGSPKLGLSIGFSWYALPVRLDVPREKYPYLELCCLEYIWPTHVWSSPESIRDFHVGGALQDIHTVTHDVA